MKKTITLLSLLIAFCFNAQAQELHYDSSAGRTYANIQPLTWVRGQPQVSRLYIWTVSDDLTNTAVLQWELRATVILDENTVQRPVLATGSTIITGSDYAAWDPESKYLFRYMAGADKLNLTIE